MRARVQITCEANRIRDGALRRCGKVAALMKDLDGKIVLMTEVDPEIGPATIFR
jgi:hypothetical protein